MVAKKTLDVDYLNQLQNTKEELEVQLAIEKNYTAACQEEVNQSLLSEVSDKVARFEAELGAKDRLIQELKSELQSLSGEMGRLKLDFGQHEEQRKQLFCMVQKLKGSMRVYCRVKPLDNQQAEDSEPFQLAARSSAAAFMQNCIEIHPSFQGNHPIGMKIQLEKEKLTYNFDGVFGPEVD